ncbi:MAG: pseudouridine synthase [Verrucomicrobia bacterium]|nr:pseudouridine synthase [Verrucomicrobiota bacterium]MBV8277825.1 pseudouridine synthase [Verrucomicrobiota bacterium]
MLIAFHKPFGVISQFTPDGSNHRTLAGFDFPPAVYPIGRLDADSEGLLLLSDEARWNARILNPERGHEREYRVQVEGLPGKEELRRLQRGILIQGRMTLPCRANRLDPEPSVWPRDPPIRPRKTVPDCWLSVVLREGKNRQLRRMTAAIGFPTLRLIRIRIGRVRLADLRPGAWRRVEEREVFGER